MEKTRAMRDPFKLNTARPAEIHPYPRLCRFGFSDAGFTLNKSRASFHGVIERIENYFSRAGFNVFAPASIFVAALVFMQSLKQIVKVIDACALRPKMSAFF